MVEPDPSILNYRGKPPLSPPKTPTERGWHAARYLYPLLLFALFYIIARFIGPNEILWGKLTSPTPADFIPIIQQRGVPIVEAIKEYKRDHGTLPPDFSELVPKYIPRHPMYGELIIRDEFRFYADQHWISYSLTPGREGWTIAGPCANGPIALPPVTIPPASASATAPN